MLEEAIAGAGSSGASAGSAKALLLPQTVIANPNTRRCLVSCAFNPTGFAVSSTLIDPKFRLPGTSALYAVFISGLPKLPCTNPCRLPSKSGWGYNVLDIKCLELKLESPLWHLNCNRYGSRAEHSRLGFEVFGVRCVSVYRLVLGDAIQSRNTPVLACWSGAPKRSPKMEEVVMKSRMLATLPLAAVLAFPASAQTSSSQDQSNPPAASQTTQSTDNMNGTGKQPLQAPAREGFWGRVNPFARKSYVKRQTDPIRDRVNELDDLTAANGKAIKDTDARSQAGIKLASDKANEADQHAIDAGNKATMAQQTAQQATTRIQTVETVVGNIDQYKASNQTEIRFKPGQTMLSKNAKDALDEMATGVKGQRGYIIEVQGFSSGKGQTAITNSQKMAESVVRYLVLNHEIPVYRIYLVGMGNAPAPTATDETAKTKRLSGGRVEISLLKNDLEQLSSNTGAPATTVDQQQQPK